MAYNFDKSIQEGNWTIEVDTTELYGYFEHNHTGTSGGLWIQRNEGKLEVFDYDGVFALPSPVIVGLEKLGITLEETM